MLSSNWRASRAAMQLFRVVAVLPLALLLAGCFTSDKPLIGPGEADFPFKSFTYHEVGDDSPETFVRSGEVYVPSPNPNEGGAVELKFKKLPSGHYLAQLTGDRNGNNEVMYLYAVIALDEPAKTARAYKLMRRDEDVGPGLRDCPDQRICIDDLAAYVALAEAAIAADGKPDATYQITATE
jgi:hypothetical protein